MGVNVKPLTHWVIYKGYRVRFRERSTDLIAGIVTTPEGKEIPFRYAPASKHLHIAGQRIAINDHGWELERVDES